jgi:hypothetical protein
VYSTPKACYWKAPVRRETDYERLIRQDDQVLSLGDIRELVQVDVPLGDASINKDLVPGKAQYIKDISRV